MAKLLRLIHDQADKVVGIANTARRGYGSGAMFCYLDELGSLTWAYTPAGGLDPNIQAACDGCRYPGEYVLVIEPGGDELREIHVLPPEETASAIFARMMDGPR